MTLGQEYLRQVSATLTQELISKIHYDMRGTGSTYDDAGIMFSVEKERSEVFNMRKLSREELRLDPPSRPTLLRRQHHTIKPTPFPTLLGQVAYCLS